jgi:Ca2+/Na+ antiporter
LVVLLNAYGCKLKKLKNLKNLITILDGLNIDSSILGITLLTWGNNLGDLGNFFLILIFIFKYL